MNPPAPSTPEHGTTPPSFPVAADAEVLARVARDLHEVGENFFRGLVEHLARSLGADLVVAAELDAGSARTLAFWRDGAVVPNVTYTLAGTPCAEIVGGGATCGWGAGIQGLFPTDHFLVEIGVQAYVGTPLTARDGRPLGLLAAMFRTPRPELAAARAVLEIYAARAGAELEREHAVRALRESERRLELALSGSDLALWDLDLAGGERRLQGAWPAMLGFAIEELPRRYESWLGQVHPDDHAVARRAFDAHLSGRIPYYEATYRMRRKDGTWAWILARGKISARDGDGRPLRMSGTSRDLSATKQLEAELLQAQKLEAVGRLAGGVAHDFNNLLTALLSAIEFAAEAVPPGSVVAQDLAVARETGLRAAELTRQLLAFARKQPVSPRVVDVAGLLAETERMLRRTLGGDVALDVHAAEGLWPVRADPTQLQQVLLNLALNARAAMPQGGRLRIDASNRLVAGLESPVSHLPQRAWVRVAVTDDGVGMDAETLARVFEPFFTTRDRGRGTGLGLASAWGIVQQAGGRMSAVSEPGHGSTFEVWLPRGDEAPLEPERAATPAAARGGETVLVVDDEAPVRDAATRGLRQHGYRVHAAASADEGLALLKKLGPEVSLLVTDVLMPGGSGLGLAAEARKLAPELPVLYVSGFSDAPHLEGGALERGAAFLGKPFGPAELAARVRALLDG